MDESRFLDDKTKEPSFQEWVDQMSNTTKLLPMQFQDSELIVQQILGDFARERNEGRKDKILIEWRVKLEKEPTLLKPFQIDKLVRDVRRRVSSTVS